MPFSSDLPDPPVPADCDLRGLDWMPWFGANLAGSDFEASVSDAVFRAAVTLWWSAWQQVPASSVPDDDAALTKLCGLGRDIRKFRKMRDQILHGFVKCRDGRLYHRFLSPVALAQWQRRQAFRRRTEAATAARRNGLRNGERNDVRYGVLDVDESRERREEIVEKEPCGSSSTSSCPNGHSPRARGALHANPRVKGTNPRQIGADFLAFWAVYPRKVGKDAALRKYEKARRSASADEILDAARRYANSVVGKEPEFIAHPLTWLNQGRWQDEDASAAPMHRVPDAPPPPISEMWKDC